MRIFFSAGEPSGDIHGSNLIHSLKRLDPGLESVGFGGDRMAAAGCAHLFPLCNHAIMGFSQVFVKLPHIIRLIGQATRSFQERRPDAVVLIDYPGFNWWIARRAHAQGIPVFYFVPPQLWAWAGWRVAKMRRYVDHVLCSLPFEESWYRERGVPAEYVGHPFFDEIPRQRLDAEFVERQRQQGGTIISILPGSRTMEVARNFPTQLRAAERIHRSNPNARFLVACFKESQQAMVEAMRQEHPALPMQSFVHKTPEIIEVGKACIAVSGSVSLELLYRCRPTVVVYRVSRMADLVIRPLLTTKYITLVNVLADKMLFPEFATARCEAGGVSDAILRWLNDDRAYAEVCRDLLALRERVARPGACDRAAGQIVAQLQRSQSLAA